MNYKIIKHIPNTLSISRILLSLLFTLVLYDTLTHNKTLLIPIIFFIIIIITDIADGNIARRTGNVTQKGTNLDVLADIMFMTLAYIPLIIIKTIPLWFLIFNILFFIEFIVTSKYMMKYSKTGDVITYDFTGKYTGILAICIPLIIMVLYNTTLIKTITILLIIITVIGGVTSVISRIHYCYKLTS
ncbi:CDP-alcohol phosphatidyltransferase family protein [Methanosphaera sp.]